MILGALNFGTYSILLIVGGRAGFCPSTVWGFRLVLFLEIPFLLFTTNILAILGCCGHAGCNFE